MCGIAGLFGPSPPELLRRMLDRVSHRGPDGWDTWSSGNVLLGHRRLAIVAVATGRQPMSSHDGRFTVTYNGEVYNHLALRAELEAKGARFATDSDTEVILEAYRAWGTAAFARMDGMFAFALWDAERRELVLARDRWGIKPLYYAEHRGLLRFASEVKALLADPELPREVDLDRVRERAVLEYIPSFHTLLRGVRVLPPGHYATVKADAQGNPAPLAARSYSALSLAAKASDAEGAVKALAEALAASVEAQRMGERPVSTILSGGLDSSLVAHLQRAAGHEVTTLTVVGGDDLPDVQAARTFAEKAGLDAREVPVDAAQVWDTLPRLLAAHEGFHYTEAFFLPLFAAVARHGPVALCGQGSDELWGGYARYRSPSSALAAHLGRLEASGHTALEPLAARLKAAHKDGATLAKWDQGAQLWDFQLRLADGTSMAAGVEVRVPFLSMTLQALSDANPWSRKLHGGVEKWVLRKAADRLGLAHDIAWRPKLPAGRATLPDAIGAVEAQAARLVPATALGQGPTAGIFQKPMELLAYRTWHEVFVERGGDASGVRLESVLEAPAWT